VASLVKQHAMWFLSRRFATFLAAALLLSCADQCEDPNAVFNCGAIDNQTTSPSAGVLQVTGGPAQGTLSVRFTADGQERNFQATRTGAGTPITWRFTGLPAGTHSGVRWFVTGCVDDGAQQILGPTSVVVN
jgi:hypothetical protein